MAASVRHTAVRALGRVAHRSLRVPAPSHESRHLSNQSSDVHAHLLVVLLPRVGILGVGRARSLVGKRTDSAPGVGCLGRGTKLGDECPARARFERGAAMAKDTQNHRSPSVMNRLPRGHEDASLRRMGQTSVWEGASAYGLCRGCEATVRAFDLLRRCYGEAKRCAPASMFPASEAVFRGACSNPVHRFPQPVTVLSHSAAFGKSNARSIGPARVGMEPSSVLWH